MCLFSQIQMCHVYYLLYYFFVSNSSRVNFTLEELLVQTSPFKHFILQVNEKSCRLRMGTYRDGVKRKGDKIGMGI